MECVFFFVRTHFVEDRLVTDLQAIFWILNDGVEIKKELIFRICIRKKTDTLSLLVIGIPLQDMIIDVWVDLIQDNTGSMTHQVHFRSDKTASVLDSKLF